MHKGYFTEGTKEDNFHIKTLCEVLCEFLCVLCGSFFLTTKVHEGIYYPDANTFFFYLFPFSFIFYFSSP